METLTNNSKKTFHDRILKVATFLFLMICFTFKAAAEESLEEAKAHAARNEFISYLMMGLGIAAVIFIAVYTALKGRKNEGSDSLHLAKPISHRPFSHKYDHHHGRRGTTLKRR